MSFNVIYLKFEKIMGTYFVNLSGQRYPEWNLLYNVIYLKFEKIKSPYFFTIFASWMQTSPFLDVNELQPIV